MDETLSGLAERGSYRSEFRVCVVSTSADVRAERDMLNRDVFPQLRRHLSERGVLLTVSDPRWEAMLAPERAREVVSAGLRELYGHRPVFVGILGWGARDAATLPWLRNIAGDADIAAQFCRRVLNSGLMRDRALFYVLDPPHDMPGSESDDAAERILELVRRDDVGLREGIAGLDELGPLLLRDLETIFEHMYVGGSAHSAAERDRRAQAQFADTHRHGYVEIGSYLERLDDHVLGESRSVVVVGESGAGKSALLVNWVDHVRDTRADVVILGRSIDAAAGADDPTAAFRSLMGDLKEYCRVPDPLPYDAAALAEAFPSWLAHAPADRLLLVVIDGVDGFAGTSIHARLLPRHLPVNVRIVLSGRDVVPPVHRRWAELRIEPLTLAQTRSITDRVVVESGGLPSLEAFNSVVDASVRPSPFFLRTIAHYMQSAGRRGGAGAFADIDTVEELMQRVLRQGEERCGAALTGRVLSLLLAARRGLAFEELSALTGADAPALAAVLGEFEPYLVDRDGLRSFIHDHVRRAVEGRYVADEGAIRKLHEELAAWFAGRPMGERRIDEEPWHWHRAGDHERLADCIAAIPMFMALSTEERQYELLGYCVALGGADAFIRRMEGCRAESSEANPSAAALDDATVLERLGRYCTTAGWLQHAERFLRAALISKRELYGDAHPGVAETLHDLAELLRHAGRFATAEEAYTAALAIREAQFDPLDPDLASLLSDLALLYRDWQKPDQALPLYRRAVALKERIHGADHPATAESLNDLALLYHDLGDLDAAVGLNLRALEIRLVRFGARHPVTATSRNNLGSVYRDMGKPDEAEREYRLALAIGEDGLGADHPHTIGTVANLASLLQSRGVLAEARDLFRRAIDTTVRTLGPDHPNAIAFSINYALVLRDAGDAAGAETVLRQALDRMRADGQRHPYIPICANNLASLLQTLERDAEALPFYEIAVEAWEDALGVEHPNVASALHNIAAMHHRAGRDDVAEPFIRRAVHIYGRQYGEEHYVTQASAALLSAVTSCAE